MNDGFPYHLNHDMVWVMCLLRSVFNSSCPPPTDFMYHECKFNSIYIMMASISTSPPVSLLGAIPPKLNLGCWFNCATIKSQSAQIQLQSPKCFLLLLFFGFSLQKSSYLIHDSSCSVGIACICKKILYYTLEI